MGGGGGGGPKTKCRAVGGGGGGGGGGVGGGPKSISTALDCRVECQGPDDRGRKILRLSKYLIIIGTATG